MGKQIILVIIILVSFLGCDSKTMELNGKLIFSVSHRIEEIDLKDCKRSTLYEANKDNIYNHLNWIGASDYIVENYNIKKGYQIELINILRGDSKVLAKGSRPLYLAENKEIVFIGGNDLYLMSIDSEQPPKVLSGNVHKYSKPPLRISVSEVAYFDLNNKITILNLENRAMRSLSIKNCIPWVFVPRNKSFVCKSQDTGDFLLINSADDQNAEKMKIDAAKFGVRENIVISNDSKYLIYSKVRKISLSEKQDVYVYDLAQKKEFKYLKDITITSGVHRN